MVATTTRPRFGAAGDGEAGGRAASVLRRRPKRRFTRGAGRGVGPVPCDHRIDARQGEPLFDFAEEGARRRLVEARGVDRRCRHSERRDWSAARHPRWRRCSAARSGSGRFGSPRMCVRVGSWQMHQRIGLGAVQQAEADTGVGGMKQRALTFDQVPVVGIVGGRQPLDGTGDEIGDDGIDGDAAAGDEDSRLTGGAERRRAGRAPASRARAPAPCTSCRPSSRCRP